MQAGHSHTLDPHMTMKKASTNATGILSFDALLYRMVSIHKVIVDLHGMLKDSRISISQRPEVASPISYKYSFEQLAHTKYNTTPSKVVVGSKVKQELMLQCLMMG
jgi:hypothetical protein